ncbi:hypothetical protein HMPREF1547_00119 [Blautia sp. KLE 1732]|nr:hypothetical protein HMPREF1547_00119 [Blautia sp. KLE 1732]
MPDGRTIYGAAAQQHIIKDDGGWDEHHRKFAERVADIAMRELEKENRARNFTVIDGKKVG